MGNRAHSSKLREKLRRLEPRKKLQPTFAPKVTEVRCPVNFLGLAVVPLPSRRQRSGAEKIFDGSESSTGTKAGAGAAGRHEQAKIRAIGARGTSFRALGIR